MVGSILGTRVLRVEDPRFITIGGRYVDDLRIDGEGPFRGAAVAHYVRSAVAHGTITVARTLLAGNRVRFVGEPIAVVVATTAAAAADAAIREATSS